MELLVLYKSHHIHRCDEAEAGWVLAWNWWSEGYSHCAPHIRGSSRAVSEWLPAYPRQLIIQTSHILQLDNAVTDSLPRGGVVRPFQPYFPITWPGSSTVTPPY
jgi:hypothetical protein